MIDGATHVSFAGAIGPRGADITAAVKQTSTFFGDAYLKDSEPARDHLQSGRLIEDSGAIGRFKKK